MAVTPHIPLAAEAPRSSGLPLLLASQGRAVHCRLQCWGSLQSGMLESSGASEGGGPGCMVQQWGWMSYSAGQDALACGTVGGHVVQW